jgi:hypothetical protein
MPCKDTNMNTRTLLNKPHALVIGNPTIRTLAQLLALLCVVARCPGQGTMTVAFDNPPLPPNTDSIINQYFESGMRFWCPGDSFGGLALVGAGNAGGSPNNGTTHLETYAGTYVAFSFDPFSPFRLVSFDATESYSTTPGPETLHVVGWISGGQGATVTTDLTTDGARQFQTYNLGPSFANVYRVDITPSSWSGFALDNVVISGVPEPSTGGLLFLGAACAFGRSRIKRRRP